MTIYNQPDDTRTRTGEDRAGDAEVVRGGGGHRDLGRLLGAGLGGPQPAVDPASGSGAAHEAITLDYRPGHSLTYSPGLGIEFETLIPNAYDPSKVQPVHIRRAARPETQDIARAALATVLRFEVHEAMEWLSVSGRRVFNPHGVGAFLEQQIHTAVETIVGRGEAKACYCRACYPYPVST